MSSVIQKHKRLIKRLKEKELEDMFNQIDLDLEIKSRMSLSCNYSIICNNIYNGGSHVDVEEIKVMLDNKKRKIAEFLQKKIESKIEVKKIRKQLSELLG